MALTSFGTDHNLALKVWARKTLRETLKQTFVGRFVSGGEDAAVYLKDDLSRTYEGKGDTVHYPLLMIPTGLGVQGDNTLRGNEEELKYFRDTLLIDQLRHAHKSAGKMSEQRVIQKFMPDARWALTQWWANVIDTSWINQISGNTDVTDVRLSGMNATIAPSSLAGNTRITYGNGTSTTENSLSASTCYMKLTNLDRLVAIARTATPQIRPFRTSRGLRYGFICHENVWFRLKTDATANSITLYDYSKAIISGGGKDTLAAPAYAEPVAEYNNVLIFIDHRLPVAPSTASVRRSVFFGAQSACIAFGSENGVDRMAWEMDKDDYNNITGIAAGMIWGVKKSSFSIDGAARDFATVVNSSYAPAL
jgi:N4-gp56 family major capsid protein